MKTILCIAESCWDVIFGGLTHMPQAGEEVFGDSFASCPGGGANTPMNLGRLGADVTFLTAVGDDEPGRQILAALQNSGVRTLGSTAVPGTRTAVSAVLSTDADRGFASYAGTSGNCFAPAQLQEELQRADLIHTYLGYSIAWDLGRQCEEAGKLLSLDASWCDAQNTPAVWQELSRCDYLKLNDVEAARITGLDDPQAALKKLAGTVKRGVVITLGSRGSIGMTAWESTTCICQEVVSAGPFRDSCGAGDAYAAGFLFGLAQQLTLAECMELGAIVSGLCVTWLGGNSPELNCTMLGKRFCTIRRKMDSMLQLP